MPCKNEGNDVSQSIIASSGYLITRRTVRSLRTLELHSETGKRNQRIFDDFILKNFEDSVANPTNCKTLYHTPYDDGIGLYAIKLPADNDLVMPDGAAVFEKPITEQWIHAELNIPRG